MFWPVALFFFIAGLCVIFARYLRTRHVANTIHATFVRPQRCQRFDGKSEVLAGIDQVVSGLFVTAGLRFNCLLCPDTLREALAMTLDSFPSFSGRLRSARIENFTAGALFEVSVRPETDARSYTSSYDWERAGAVFILGNLAAPQPNQPLLHARLSLFPASGVSVLYVALNHALGDGHTTAHFIRAWSSNCGGRWPAQAPAPPQPLGCRRVLQFAPADRPNNLGDLIATYPSPLTSPLDRVARKLFFPRLIWAFLTTRSLEIRIDAAGVRQWKSRVMDALPTGGWVSTFEVMYAMLFLANAVAVNLSAHKPSTAYPIVNLRGRVFGPSSDFCGNLWTTPQVLLRVGAGDIVGSDAVTAAVVNIATQLHRGLRGVLAKNEELTSLMKWFNAVQDAGYGDQLQFMALTDSAAADAIFMNELYHFPWFDVDMGSDQRAAGFIYPSVFMRNFWTLLPRERESGDLTLHISFKREQGRAFLRAIKDANLPFYQVHPHCR